MNNLNENYSAKLKRVFIEIYNYSFLHGFAENGKPDNRFIGRERLLEHFKSILTKSERKSGIYLVTGYRGMGKTSFVNKAIEEVYYPDIKIKAVLNWAIYLLISFLVTVFQMFLFYKYQSLDVFSSLLDSTIVNSSLFIISIASFYFLNRETKSLKECILNVDEGKAKLKHKKYFEKFVLTEFITSIILLTILIYYIIFDNKSENSTKEFLFYLKTIFAAFILFFLAICIANYLYWFIKSYKVNSAKDKKNKKNKNLLYYIIDPFRRFINYSSTVTIHLNLGYSNLKEINVLKLIAKNLSSSFETHRHKFSINKLIRLVLIAVIICFTSLIYNLNPIKRFNSLLRNAMGLTLYFPSQNDYFLQNDSITLGYIVEEMKMKRKLSSENYFVYTQSVSNVFDNHKIENALTYLTNLDKYLINYLNIDSLMKLPYHEFKKDLILKNDYYFNLYNIYSVFKDQSIDKISQSDTAIKLKTKELTSLIMHFEENPDLVVNKQDVSLASLYRLKKVSDLYSEYSSFKQVKKNVLTISNHLDYIVSQAYYYFRQILPLSPIIKMSRIVILPKSIDYLYFIYIILFFYFFKIVQRLFNYNRPSLKSVIKRLNFINELINSNITFEKSAEVNISSSAPFRLGRRKNQSFPQADEREIEKHLIEIINDINRLPINSYRSEFIFVFDELDKIEANKDNSNSILFSPEATRSRLQAVISLLSNLKYFLSTAQSKFIFIAGREMFDASLADVSDRNFKIGSIFHDVFYVESFYSDTAEYDIEDITSRTEQYVCQFLQPTFEKDSSLIKYNEFLLKMREFNEYDPTHKNTIQRILAKQKREKVIYLLQQFIVYLNHQSAGAPSKINSYFENYVINSDMFRSNWSEYSILVGNPNSENLFLFFDFYNQYELGLVNYLIIPFNYSINKVIRNYGDKLIVSASFLHNHLFKFHRNAFSWRDLESTPEIVDVNKNPELRDFLSRLIEFMANTHLQEIICGVYDFKFTKTISQELLFLSHISEVASANFNFTLDESLIVKQFYLEQLQKLKNHTSNKKEDSNDYIFSEASVNLTIADLCFYDGDYSEAILFYLEAIQQIRNKKIEELSITQLVLLTRNMLKLGYSLERRKTYDSAQLTYCEITDTILNKIESVTKKNHNIDYLKTIVSNTSYLYQPLLAKLYLIEKASLDGVTHSDLNNIYNEFNKLHNLLIKVEQNVNPESLLDKYLIQAKFWNKIGNLYYYKNVSDDNETRCPFPSENNQTYKTCTACKKYLDSLNLIFIKHSLKTSIIYDHKYQSNLAAIKELLREHDHKIFSVLEYKIIAVLLSNYANICLNCSLNETLSVPFTDELQLYLTGQKKLDELEKIENKLEMMLFSNCVSAYFYMIANEFTSAANQLKNILNFFNVYTVAWSNCDPQLITNIEAITSSVSNKAIKYIYGSYDYIHIYEINKFKKVYNNPKSTLTDISLRRISINSDLDEINVLNEVIKFNLFPDRVKNDEILSVYCYVSPYNIMSKMYNRILNLKLRSIMNRLLLTKKLGLSEEPKNYSSIFKSVIENIERKISFFSEEYSFIDFIEYLISDSIFCNFEITKICNTFDRSFSLNYSLLAEAHFDLWIWAEYLNGYQLLNSALYQIKSKKSSSDIIDFIKTNTNEIQITDLQISLYIQHLSKSKYIQAIKPTDITKTIEQLIEPHNFQYITPTYQCEKAISAFNDAKNTHKQGNTYKNLIDNMYYLNDDFNDELYHFSIALERFKINSKIIEKQIEQLVNKSKDSRIYKQNRYIEEVID